MRGDEWFLPKDFNVNSYNEYLRAHETAHYAQQRKFGFANFYNRIVKEYSRATFTNPNGLLGVYSTPGTLEIMANQYAFDKLGYYYDTRLKYRRVRP